MYVCMCVYDTSYTLNIPTILLYEEKSLLDFVKKKTNQNLHHENILFYSCFKKMVKLLDFMQALILCSYLLSLSLSLFFFFFL